MPFMKATTEQVFMDALSLRTRARAELAQKLPASLEKEACSPKIEPARKHEFIERYRAYDQGQLKEREAADVLHDTYRKVKGIGNAASPRISY